MGARSGPEPLSRSQSRKVTPGGAVQSWDPGSRTHMSSASSAYAAHASRGSPSAACRAGALVRPGSMLAHTCCRAERQPVGFPSRNGELANAATSTGPIACSIRQRERYPD